MRFVGQRIPRVEDNRLLTGRGKYVDDIQLPNMVHAAFVRSSSAHAQIQVVDEGKASASAGVVGVLSGDDIQALSSAVSSAVLPSGPRWPLFYALTTDKVRFVGDPVAMVMADSRYQAEDACERVEVDYQPLPVIASYEHAADQSRAPLFEELGDNVMAINEPVTFGDVDGAFAEADRIITATFHQHRVANVPMETRGVVADYDPSSGELTYYASTQNPHALTRGSPLAPRSVTTD